MENNVRKVSINEQFEKYLDKQFDADRGSRDKLFFSRNQIIRAMEHAHKLGQDQK